MNNNNQPHDFIYSDGQFELEIHVEADGTVNLAKFADAMEKAGLPLDHPLWRAVVTKYYPELLAEFEEAVAEEKKDKEKGAYHV